MEELKIIKHRDISTNELLDVCKIKSAFGNYTLESQIEWIKANLCDDDIHFLLYLNNKLIGYLNLIPITLTINYKKFVGYGVGNVCTTEKGKGYGRRLMTKLNQHIILLNIFGLLFCKIDVYEFYQQFGWVSLGKDILNIPFDNRFIETMIFNCGENVEQLSYEGKLF